MLALGALTLVLVAGCGNDSDSSTSEPATPTAPKVSPLGPFFGECGSVTDDEVRDAFGVPSLQVTRNSVGCVWEVGGPLSPSVSFSWYRGSPIGREAAGSGLIGRPPETIQIDGHEAFQGQIPGDLCEIGVGYGDDFYHWSVTWAGQQGPVDPCQVARNLAEKTAQRTTK